MALLEKVTCDICGKPVEARFAVVIHIESPHDLSSNRVSVHWDACNECGHRVGAAILEMYAAHHKQGA